MKVYQGLAKTICAYKRCLEKSNDYADKHKEAIDRLMENAPCGSGFDNGTKLDIDASNSTRLVFTTGFHHMNESGMYEEWTKHQVTIKPDFELEYDIRITGRNKNQIKEYISEQFCYFLDDEVTNE